MKKKNSKKKYGKHHSLNNLSNRISTKKIKKLRKIKKNKRRIRKIFLKRYKNSQNSKNLVKNGNKFFRKFISKEPKNILNNKEIVNENILNFNFNSEINIENIFNENSPFENLLEFDDHFLNDHNNINKNEEEYNNYCFETVNKDFWINNADNTNTYNLADIFKEDVSLNNTNRINNNNRDNEANINNNTNNNYINNNSYINNNINNDRILINNNNNNRTLIYNINNNITNNNIPNNYINNNSNSNIHINPNSEIYLYSNNDPLLQNQILIIQGLINDILNGEYRRPNHNYLNNIKDNISKIKIKEKKYMENNCPICIEAFKRYQTVYKLSCGHIFHVRCLNKELKSRQKCPLCRSAI